MLLTYVGATAPKFGFDGTDPKNVNLTNKYTSILFNACYELSVLLTVA